MIELLTGLYRAIYDFKNGNDINADTYSTIVVQCGNRPAINSYLISKICGFKTDGSKESVVEWITKLKSHCEFYKQEWELHKTWNNKDYNLMIYAYGKAILYCSTMLFHDCSKHEHCPARRLLTMFSEEEYIQAAKDLYIVPGFMYDWRQLCQNCENQVCELRKCDVLKADTNQVTLGEGGPLEKQKDVDLLSYPIVRTYFDRLKKEHYLRDDYSLNEGKLRLGPAAVVAKVIAREIKVRDWNKTFCDFWHLPEKGLSHAIKRFYIPRARGVLICMYKQSTTYDAKVIAQNQADRVLKEICSNS